MSLLLALCLQTGAGLHSKEAWNKNNNAMRKEKKTIDFSFYE